MNGGSQIPTSPANSRTVWLLQRLSWLSHTRRLRSDTHSPVPFLNNLHGPLFDHYQGGVKRATATIVGPGWGGRRSLGLDRDGIMLEAEKGVAETGERVRAECPTL